MRFARNTRAVTLCLLTAKSVALGLCGGLVAFLHYIFFVARDKRIFDIFGIVKTPKL